VERAQARHPNSARPAPRPVRTYRTGGSSLGCCSRRRLDAGAGVVPLRHLDSAQMLSRSSLEVHGDQCDCALPGTPHGVGLGHKPPIYLLYLRAGQEVRAGVRGLGEQHQRVVECG